MRVWAFIFSPLFHACLRALCRPLAAWSNRVLRIALISLPLPWWCSVRLSADRRTDITGHQPFVFDVRAADFLWRLVSRADAAMSGVARRLRPSSTSALAIVDVALLSIYPPRGPEERGDRPAAGACFSMPDYDIRASSWALLAFAHRFAVTDGYDPRNSPACCAKNAGAATCERRQMLEAATALVRDPQGLAILASRRLPIRAAWPLLLRRPLPLRLLPSNPRHVLRGSRRSSAPGRFSIPQQDARTGVLAQRVGYWVCSPAASFPALIFGFAFGNLRPRRALPPRRDLRAASKRASSSACSSPSALLCGLTSIAMP